MIQTNTPPNQAQDSISNRCAPADFRKPEADELLTVFCEFCSEEVTATRRTLAAQNWEITAHYVFCPLHGGI